MDNLNKYVIIAQLINFGILFLLFKYFVAKRLNRAITVRKALVRKLERGEKEYQEILDKANEDKLSILSQARKDAMKLSYDSEKLALSRKEIIVEDAEKRAEMIIEGGKSEIEKERLTMMNDVKKYIIDISLRLNKKIFNGKGVDKKFMEREMDNLI